MKTKLSICNHTLTTAKQAISHRGKNKNVCEYSNMKNVLAKIAKQLFFIIKYANLWRSCFRRRCGCLSSLIVHLLSQNLKLIVYGCTIWTFRFCYCLFFVISSLTVKEVTCAVLLPSQNCVDFTILLECRDFLWEVGLHVRTKLSISSF